MTQRSEGLFPREGFNLDKGVNAFLTAKGTAGKKNFPIPFSSVKTIRVTVIGEDVQYMPANNGGLAGGATDATITVTAGGQDIVVPLNVDSRFGTAIGHARGFNCTKDATEFQYAYAAGANGTAGTTGYDLGTDPSDTSKSDDTHPVTIPSAMINTTGPAHKPDLEHTSTSGNGRGMKIKLVVTSAGATAEDIVGTIEDDITDIGVGYKVGDTITFSEAFLKANGLIAEAATGDLVFKIGRYQGKGQLLNKARTATAADGATVFIEAIND